jgi:dTDP-4-amino-4,6-dideoxygalactose transaminase
MIPYEDLSIVNASYRKVLAARFDEIVQRGRFILDQEVELFEQEFASYVGCSFGIGTGSGYDALGILLRSFGLTPGGEVIVPSNTCMPTVLAVLNAGLRPVLVEPDLRTYNLDPLLTARAITGQTVAIVAVHLYGTCAPMDELCVVAENAGIPIVEDCAQAHGASLSGRMTGSWGAAAAFSFYPTKNLGALGDGGMVVTQSADMAAKVKAWRCYGETERDTHVYPGVNSRLDELQAAFLRIKLRDLDRMLSHRWTIADIYDAGLGPDFIRPLRRQGYTDANHIYAIRHPERDRLREHLTKHGVQTKIHYPVPPYRHPALASVLSGTEFPIADEISRTIVSLPVSTAIDVNQAEEVVRILNLF